MAEVKKRTVVIASVLKPVNDTRMFEKIGLSLAETKRFDVHVIGFPATLNSSVVHFHPLPFFTRLSLRRMLVPWAILKKIRKLHPSLIIITTHELVIVALIAKMLMRCKIIYDLQENYYRNILFTSAFPRILRPFVALYVRLKEIVASPFIDHYFLAEAAYTKELKFTGTRVTVLENKLKKPVSTPHLKNNTSRGHLIFSGTLAENTGVFTAIQIAVKLHTIDPQVKLTIIGHCPQRHVLEKITNTIEPYPFITLIGGNMPVAHERILEQIQLAGAGIIAYDLNPSTSDRFPTKLFEYMGYRLPMLLIDHQPWVEFASFYNAAVTFNHKRLNIKHLYTQLKTQQFYTQEPSHVFWESEQPRLIRQVLQILE